MYVKQGTTAEYAAKFSYMTFSANCKNFSQRFHKNSSYIATLVECYLSSWSINPPTYHKNSPVVFTSHPYLYIASL